jgi:hypothetical protein
MTDVRRCAPTRAAQWVPYPPRVEVSSLGEAAALTGALSVGVSRALDSVFVNRGAAGAHCLVAH